MKADYSFEYDGCEYHFNEDGYTMNGFSNSVFKWKVEGDILFIKLNIDTKEEWTAMKRDAFVNVFFRTRNNYLFNKEITEILEEV